ncbi:hypothetical protein NPIL_655351 [Nephila pilipes]|uniref:Neurotransmitter-gated ion-channel ligand-binding domain-containing protein n=1 Tax=Nephila pilipes TaxID=299642 RepID=A0A8X6M7X0_NEPPI|nr:hypothetical protein NPIL_655351 [Nephila pilipes]
MLADLTTNVSLALQKYRLDGYLFVYWKDDRVLTNQSVGATVMNECSDEIWYPRLIYKNTDVGLPVDNRQDVIAITNSQLFYVKRFSHVCQMAYHSYPFDSQYCEYVITFKCCMTFYRTALASLYTVSRRTEQHSLSFMGLEDRRQS